MNKKGTLKLVDLGTIEDDGAHHWQASSSNKAKRFEPLAHGTIPGPHRILCELLPPHSQEVEVSFHLLKLNHVKYSQVKFHKGREP
ncbi:hypothetical protein ACHAWF_015506 [Thalassiosira exigua]